MQESDLVIGAMPAWQESDYADWVRTSYFVLGALPVTRCRRLRSAAPKWQIDVESILRISEGPVLFFGSCTIIRKERQEYVLFLNGSDNQSVRDTWTHGARSLHPLVCHRHHHVHQLST